MARIAKTSRSVHHGPGQESCFNLDYSICIDNSGPVLVNHRVCGHRDWGRGASCVRTACPGINVYKRLPAIREQAAALIPHIQDFHLMELLKRG
ncbi:hypothetical protein ATI61_11049 [Archangium gephyra]|uniref:Uncharacterized protein n=1 Tax=Archangium gephyra TaxID=48 RepID=A0ABX9JTT5_9BACT|nr:hypothetical protein ATI61_11049 [Archangium gephyra]